MAYRYLSLSIKPMLVALGVAFGAAVMAGSSFAEAPKDGFQAGNALKVIIDRAKVIRIAKAADTVIIGNPAIVDATIQDAQTLVLTGRTFGITNLIVLDSDGDVVVDETVVVQGHETNMVRIYRQAERETLACSPVCESSLMIGDERRKFDATQNQITARDRFAKGN